MVTSLDELLAGGDESRCYLERAFLLWGTSEGGGNRAVWGSPDAADEAAGTSFREEQNEARLRHATHLLATDAKLVATAHDLGFASPQHFATWFRQQADASPSAWRAR